MSMTMKATAAKIRTTIMLPMPIPFVEEQPAEEYQAHQEDH